MLTKIENNYKNDISIVVCYGSYISGIPHENSDLDFFFIPKTQKGYEMNLQFIIDNIGYDFWPISWERAEKIADFEESITSIIADGVVIYYCDYSDLKKFNLLKQRIKDIISKPDNKEILINKAEKLLANTKIKFFNMKYVNDDIRLVNQKCYEISLYKG